jgi:hypothetical protein
MSEGYDPNKSKVSQDKMADFLLADIDPDITSVPGIGPAAVRNLAESNITTTYQLIGQFLLLRGDNMGTQAHCDAFWYWLQEQGINAHRSGIIETIAEKVETMMPGLYVKDELDIQKMQQ